MWNHYIKVVNISIAPKVLMPFAMPHSIVIPYHCPSTNRLLSVTINQFTFSKNFGKRNYTTFTISHLDSVTQHSYFEIHSWLGLYQWFIPFYFYCQALFHCMYRLQFIYPLICSGTCVVSTLGLLKVVMNIYVQPL